MDLVRIDTKKGTTYLYEKMGSGNLILLDSSNSKEPDNWFNARLQDYFEECGIFGSLRDQVNIEVFVEITDLNSNS